MFMRIILLVLLLLQGVGAAYAQDPAPKAVAENPHWDFGRVASGTALEHGFSLRNVGTMPLRVENVRLSGEGLKARVSQTIPPGESREVVAKIDTSSLAGPWAWQIALQTNDEAKPALSYNMEAYVYLPLEVDPLQLFFSLYDDETATKRITITNHQADPLAIKDIEKKGGHFQATVSTLEAGRKYRLDVTVPESVGPGRYLEAVRLNTDDPEHPTVQVGVNIFVKRNVYVFPDSVSFGHLTAQQTNDRKARELLTQTLLVKKRSGDFAITGIESTVPFLSIQKTPSGRAATFRIDISLADKEVPTGPLDGELKIKTDAPGFPELLVPITGEIK